MWKSHYRLRHVWLLLFFKALCSGGLQQESAEHRTNGGRHILSVDNHSTPSSFRGIVPDCVPPSLEEFPDDFFSQEQRVRGGLLVHALIVAYLCSMLAIVCDEYFVPCLKAISSHFKVPEDIAGATFMAVGTSSPELFSSVIGAFVTEGDIGVGTVVGSAVFNVLAVTGAAGLVVGTATVHLDWYPITRDCAMYVLTISTLVVIIHDNLVTWIEALILVSMFVGYLILLYFNCHVQRVTVRTAKNVSRWWCRSRRTMDDLPRTIVDETSALLFVPQVRYHSNEDSACPSSGSTSLMASSELTTSGESDTLAKESGHFEHPPVFVPELIRDQKYVIVKDGDKSELPGSKDLDGTNLWEMPEGSFLAKSVFFITWLPNFLFTFTIPRCHLPGRFKYFPLTFLACICWLGLLSYMCFWMVAVIGYTLGIPDTVSGLTILAAGTSVPEMVSSVLVVKSGLGNMALCNLLGSNIFDILFCLGVPWLAKTLLNRETRSLVINSSALTYTTLILLTVVILFYLTLVVCGWRLGRRYGVVAFILYASFLVTASLYESNVFGDFNPPTCTS